MQTYTDLRFWTVQHFQYQSRVTFWQTKEELRAISTTLPQHPSEVACLALFVLLTNRGSSARDFRNGRQMRVCFCTFTDMYVWNWALLCVERATLITANHWCLTVAWDRGDGGERGSSSWLIKGMFWVQNRLILNISVIYCRLAQMIILKCP